MLASGPRIQSLGVVCCLCHYTGEQLLDIDSARGGEPNAPPGQHFTFIFNTFVMMTLFNEINARKIHGQRNVFEGLHRNYIFAGIWVATFLSQVRSFNLYSIV